MPPRSDARIPIKRGRPLARWSATKGLLFDVAAFPKSSHTYGVIEAAPLSKCPKNPFVKTWRYVQ
jgi:hypothetical protein